jgi:hypothetical protein
LFLTLAAVASETRINAAAVSNAASIVNDRPQIQLSLHFGFQSMVGCFLEVAG